MAWILLSSALFAALGAAVSGCGGSDGGETTPARSGLARPAPCRVGKPAAPHVPDTPTSWTEAPQPAIALACSKDPVDPGGAIVGYPLLGGGSCVSVYSSRLGEPFDELCEMPGSPWTAQCERRGCTHYFWHESDYTVFDGPTAAAVAKVEVLIDGKPLRQGVMMARVRGKLEHAAGAEEPFGFFAAYVPRCVESGKIVVELIGADGSKLGVADPWDVTTERCGAA